MAKSKFIEDEESRRVKQNYKELLAQLNPKPSEEVLEQLREKYRKQREQRGSGG